MSVASNVARAADVASRRFPGTTGASYTSRMNESLLDRVTIEPGKCGGKPCIRGKRIRVTDLLELLANEASIEEIVTDYPGLEREDVLAAIAYAARQTNHTVIRVA